MKIRRLKKICFLQKIRAIGNSRFQINKAKLKEISRAVKQSLEHARNILLNVKKQWIDEFRRKKPFSENAVNCWYYCLFFKICIGGLAALQLQLVDWVYASVYGVCLKVAFGNNK